MVVVAVPWIRMMAVRGRGMLKGCIQSRLTMKFNFGLETPRNRFTYLVQVNVYDVLVCQPNHTICACIVFQSSSAFQHRMNGLRIATVSRSLPARALVKGRVLISRPSSLILPPTPSLSSPTSTSGGKRTLSSSVAGKILLGQPQKVLHQHINLSASLGSRRAFASLSTMTSLPKNDDGPLSSDMPSTQLILPPSETRPHRLITLPNNIQVILIHDPECDKAAAAMDVGVGHLEDPENLQGCAHFW